jgi:hypothetical protein
LVNGVVTAPAGEERLPLFPTVFEENGRKRRIWAGLIPVAARETYEAGGATPAAADTAGDALSDPRAAAFQAEVLDAIVALSKIDTAVVDDDTARTQLMFTLIAFGDFLQRELPSVWSALNGGPAVSGPAESIRSKLATTFIDTTSWRSLIISAADAAFRTQLFQWQTNPTLSFPTLANTFTDSEIRTGALGLLSMPNAEGVWLNWVDAPGPSLSAAEQAFVNLLNSTSIRSTSLAALLTEASGNRARIEGNDFDRRLEPIRQAFTRDEIETLSSTISSGGIEDAAAAVLETLGEPVAAPAGTVTGPAESHYIVRMIYERSACRGAAPAVLSAASQPFRLATFFDPDAPIRPMRIQLPVDTSFEGLSKFPKAVTMLISDQLRKQTSQARDAGLKDLSEGSVGDAPSGSLGLICSFSIPIITICAFILLMIIVQLLNIVFWWIPLFRICLPLNLKAKAS